MNKKLNPREGFLDLVRAHETEDEDAMQRIGEQLRSSGQPLRLVVEESTSWDESLVEGFSEFPVVTQSFKVYFGDDVLYEGVRSFGCSFEDPTHTGLGGEWVTIRIDDSEHAMAEQALEDLGLDLEWPTVPPAR